MIAGFFIEMRTFFSRSLKNQ